MSWLSVKYKNNKAMLNYSELKDLQNINKFGWEIYYDENVEIFNFNERLILVEGNIYFIKKYKDFRANDDFFSHVNKNNEEKYYDFLDGNFTLANFSSSEYFLADIFNMEELFYYENENLFLVSNRLELLINSIKEIISLNINFYYIVLYVINCGKFLFDTPYENVIKIMPGFMLQYFKKKSKSKRWWFPRDDFEYYKNNIEVGISKVFSESVLRMTDKWSDFLIEYTAGIDSSMLKGLFEAENKRAKLLHFVKLGINGESDIDYKYILDELNGDLNNIIFHHENGNEFIDDIGKTLSKPNIFFYINKYYKYYDEYSEADGDYTPILNGSAGEFAYDASNLSLFETDNLKYILGEVKQTFLNESSLIFNIKNRIFPILNKQIIKFLYSDMFICNNKFFVNKIYIKSLKHFNKHLNKFFKDINKFGEIRFLINMGYWWSLEKNAGHKAFIIYPYLNRELIFSNMNILKNLKLTNSHHREFQITAGKPYLSENISKRNNKGGSNNSLINNLKHNKENMVKIVQDSAIYKNKLIDIELYKEQIEKYINKKEFENVIGLFAVSLWLNSIEDDKTGNVSY